MAVRLPRLNRQTEVVAESRRPTQQFQQYWQRTLEAIELALNTAADLIEQIIDILVRLGFAEETASGALELAESAINPGGTIKDDKVLTPSIAVNAVTERYLTQTIVDIPLPNGVETEVVSVTVSKVEAESDVDVEASLRLVSSDDIRGTIKLYRGATMIDEFAPYMNGAGGTFRISQVLPFTDIGAPAGTHTYRVTFTRNGGASSVLAQAGSLIRAKEYKR